MTFHYELKEMMGLNIRGCETREQELAGPP